MNVRLLIETRSNALTIAAPAVQQGPQGPYVYVVKPDGTVESRGVSVAQLGNIRAVIGFGLTAGEQVVIAGQSRIQPDSHVTLFQGHAAKAALGQEQQTQQTADPMNISAPFIARPIATIPADGGSVAVRVGGIRAVADIVAAECQLPDYRCDGPALGRRSADHVGIGCDSARGAVRANPRHRPDDLVEHARLYLGDDPVRSEPEHRRRRGRRPRRD